MRTCEDGARRRANAPESDARRMHSQVADRDVLHTAIFMGVDRSQPVGRARGGGVVRGCQQVVSRCKPVQVSCGRAVGCWASINQEAIMTTTTAAQLRHSPPHRIRRNVTAALVGGALLASTALVVNRITDDDSPRAVQATVSSAPAVSAEAVAPQQRLVTNEAASQACTEGYPDACQFAHTWALEPVLAILNPIALDACNSGYTEACVPAVNK